MSDFTTGLRKLADFLDAHPKYDSPNHDLTVNVFLSDRADLELVARSGFGPLEKRGTNRYFYLRKKFSPQISLDFNIDREHVCERVVTKKLIAAEPERLVPAVPEHEEEIVEWKCPDSLLVEAR